MPFISTLGLLFLSRRHKRAPIHGDCGRFYDTAVVRQAASRLQVTAVAVWVHDIYDWRRGIVPNRKVEEGDSPRRSLWSRGVRVELRCRVRSHPSQLRSMCDPQANGGFYPECRLSSPCHLNTNNGEKNNQLVCSPLLRYLNMLLRTYHIIRFYLAPSFTLFIATYSSFF